MKVSIVRIGNSRGIRIPKPLLKECGIEDFVDLEVERGRLLVLRAMKTRSGWEEAFRTMAHRGEDALLDRESQVETRWERAEWRW